MKVNNTALTRCFSLLIACLTVLPAFGQQEETPLTRLFDTGVASAAPLPNEAVSKRAGWQLVPEDNVTHLFTGDAVFLNDKLAVVLRKQGRGAEVYSKTASGFQHRATIGHTESADSRLSTLDSRLKNQDSALSTQHSTRLSSPKSGLDAFDTLKIIENNSGAVMVEATFKGAPVRLITSAATAGPAMLRFRLTTGETILEIRPAERAVSVSVQSMTRYVVVPDFFGDDLVFGAESFRGRGLPAENFCLQLLDGGDAIAMAVWQSSEQNVWIDAASAEKEGTLSSTRIDCFKDKSIWLAFLECPGIWRAANVSDKSEGPFPAKWRRSFVRENGVADSWDSDSAPSPEQIAGKHTGPLVVYPIDRSSSTPLTAVCPTDVMRNTLGVGPCQYILAVEGLAAEGDPTPNNVMSWVEKQFEQKKESKAADDIKERLEQMTRHVADARKRIARYGEFAGQARSLLAGKRGAESFAAIVVDLNRSVEAGMASAASPERAKQLAAEVTALIGKENAAAECRRLGEQLRAIGATQDKALAKCRMAVRRLKQEGRTMAIVQPQDVGLAQDVQRLAEQMLQTKTTTSTETGGLK
jgi:hypothetical protein